MNVFATHVAMTDVDPNRYPQRTVDGKVQSWALPGSLPSSLQIAAYVERLHPTVDSKVMRDSTSDALAERLQDVAVRAVDGDLVIFTYIGHGAQVKTKFVAIQAPGAVASGEPDLRFEVSILLHDRMMVANEYRGYVKLYKPGVRYVNVIDGCGLGTFYSETIHFKGLRTLMLDVRARVTPPSPTGPGKPIPCGVDSDLFARLYALNKDTYDKYLPDPGSVSVRGVNLGACKDGETAYQDENGKGSYFSMALASVLAEGPEPSSYVDLRSRTEARLADYTKPYGVPAMHPTLLWFGTGGDADLASAPFR